MPTETLDQAIRRVRDAMALRRGEKCPFKAGDLVVYDEAKHLDYMERFYIINKDVVTIELYRRMFHRPVEVVDIVDSLYGPQLVFKGISAVRRYPSYFFKLYSESTLSGRTTLTRVPDEEEI